MIDWVYKAVSGLLLSALVACGGYAIYLKAEVSDLTKKVSDRDTTIGEKDVAIALYDSNAKANDSLIATFRASLEEAQKMQAAKADEIAKALTAVQVLVEKKEAYSATLLATTPKSSNICKEAEDMINSYLDNERSGQ